MVAVLLMSFALASCARLSKADVDTSGEVLLQKGKWEATSFKGNVRNVGLNGAKVVDFIGGLHVEEIKEVGSFADCSLFFGKGRWQSEPYAMWEARLDEGRYYISHINQVTHIGDEVTWTAHVLWLPPLYWIPPHMKTEVRLPDGAFTSIKGIGKPVALDTIDGKGRAITMAGTDIWQEYALVLDGPAGKIRLIVNGMEQAATVLRKPSGSVLIFREDAPRPVSMPNSGRARWYGFTDVRVKRLSIRARALGDSPAPERPDFVMPEWTRSAHGKAEYAAGVDRKTQGKGYQINYPDLRGARSKNDKRWNVGWWMTTRKLDDKYKALQGVWYQDFDDGTKVRDTSVAVSTGLRRISGGELVPAAPDGLELPNLGIMGDMMAFVQKDGHAPERYLSDDGKTVKEMGLTSTSVKGTPQWWFEKKPTLNGRRGSWPWPKQQQFYTRYRYLNSITLDSNNNGLWNPANGNVLDLPSYRMKMKLGWVCFMPATWFDVAARKGDQVVFRYAAKDGEKGASIALHPDYVGRSATRIGIIGRFGSAPYGHFDPGIYIVQAAAGKGRIIGKIPDSIHDDHLAIVAGSLRVKSGGTWQPMDRIHADKRPWFASQETLGKNHRASEMPDFSSEHAYWEEARIADWGYFKVHAMGGSRHYGTPYRDPFMDTHATPVRLRAKPTWYEACARNGMKAIGIYESPVSLDTCPTEFIGEYFNPDKGSFYKSGRIDMANPEAVAWYTERIRRQHLPFRNSGVAFITTGEELGVPRVGYGPPNQPHWSKAALASYRKFTGNPDIKLPADARFKETERTTSKVSDKEWQTFLAWGRDIYANRDIAIAQGACQALGSDSRFYGGAMFGSARTFYPVKDIERILASPYFGIFVDEYPRRPDADAARAIKLARKHGKRLIYLQHDCLKFSDEDTTTFAGREACFKEWGMKYKPDGLVMCGLRMHDPAIRKFWFALMAKCYGKGRMSIAEADKIIKELKASDKAAPPTKGKAVIPLGKDAKKVTIARVSDIKIDGKLNDWRTARQYDLDRYFQLLTADSLKRKGWLGKNDLSGTASFGYDKDAMYYAIRIKDQTVLTRYSSVSNNIYDFSFMGLEGDQIELCMLRAITDVRVTRIPTAAQRSNDGWHIESDIKRQYVLVPGKNIAYMYEGTKLKPESRIACATSILSDGYVIELRIPWQVVGKVQPKKGDSIAFDFFVKDRDRKTGRMNKVMAVFSSCRIKPWGYICGWATGKLE